MHRLMQQLQEKKAFVRVDINGTIVPASRTRHGDSSMAKSASGDSAVCDFAKTGG